MSFKVADLRVDVEQWFWIDAWKEADCALAPRGLVTGGQMVWRSAEAFFRPPCLVVLVAVYGFRHQLLSDYMPWAPARNTRSMSLSLSFDQLAIYDTESRLYSSRNSIIDLIRSWDSMSLALPHICNLDPGSCLTDIRRCRREARAINPQCCGRRCSLLSDPGLCLPNRVPRPFSRSSVTN